MISTEFGVNIKVLRLDNSREFVNSSLSTYLAENGIIHQTSCVDTLQQNGVAERKNRHLLALKNGVAEFPFTDLIFYRIDPPLTVREYVVLDMSGSTGESYFADIFTSIRY